MATQARPIVSKKVVLLGDMGVGKSCIVSRFVRNEFHSKMDSTIGAAYVQQNVSVDNCTVRFEIWDTAGQERYRSLAPMYYRGAAAAIIVLDVTQPDSFAAAKRWVTELESRGDSGTVLALAANKCDEDHRRRIAREDIQEYAKSRALIYMETSAKTGFNINDLFVHLAQALPLNEVPPKVLVQVNTKRQKSGCC